MPRQPTILKSKKGEIKWMCMFCSRPIACKVVDAGRGSRCPSCKNEVTIPSIQQATNGGAWRKAEGANNHDADWWAVFVVAGVALLGSLVVLNASFGEATMIAIVAVGIFYVIIAIAKTDNKVDQRTGGNISPPPIHKTDRIIPTSPRPTNSPPRVSPSASTTLKIATRVKTIHLEGTDIEAFEFSMMGVFSLTQAIYKPELVIKMHVVDTGALPPVLSMIDQWQAEDSVEFEIKIPMDDTLSRGAGAQSWLQIGGVPIEILNFPKSGACKLITTLTVNDGLKGRQAVSVKNTISYTVSGHGYLESFQRDAELQSYMIQLALQMASVDGQTDDEEIAVIQNWGKKMVKALPDNQQSKRKKELNDSLSKATELIRGGKNDEMEKSALTALRDEAEPRELYDAYELCLAVAEADGAAHPEEMALLSRMAEGLGLDEEKARRLLDKKMANVEFVFSDDHGSQDKHLGIIEAMDKDEIRKHLSKLYRKYNSRKSHDDPDVRAKAKKWLDMIADARARHIK